MMSTLGSEESCVLPGFRFHPTDQELVGFYLRRMIQNKPIVTQLIKQIDIYKYDPWDLPKGSTLGEENEWYFFCKRGRKYKNSVRPNRVTGSGFWKATGIDKPVYTNPDPPCIGLKKSLVYYIGSAGKGSKTDWMMHEFRFDQSSSQEEAEMWTLCRIFKRNISYKTHSKYGDHQPKQCLASRGFDPDDGNDISFLTPFSSFKYDLHRGNQEYVASQLENNSGGGEDLVMAMTSNGVFEITDRDSGFITSYNEWDELISEVVEHPFLYH